MDSGVRASGSSRARLQQIVVGGGDGVLDLEQDGGLPLVELGKAVELVNLGAELLGVALGARLQQGG